MQAVRNALLHRRTADSRLVEVAPERFRLGEPIALDDDHLRDYGVAVHAYAGSLGLGATLLLAEHDPEATTALVAAFDTEA